MSMDDREALKARFASRTRPFAPQAPDDANGKASEPIRDTLNEAEPVMRPGFDQVKLKIRRDQAKNALGQVVFSVHFIAELSPEAHKAVRHYGFGKDILYQKDLELKLSFNFFLQLWRIFWLWITRKRWRITVNDIVKGRTVKCKTILDVLDVEDDIRSAAEIFAKILRAAAWFGGEEVIDL